jgi:hypothetical protein
MVNDSILLQTVNNEKIQMLNGIKSKIEKISQENAVIAPEKFAYAECVRIVEKKIKDLKDVG